MNVVVVGGGWAGLACAVELSGHGHTVTVLEAAHQVGGRARRIRYRGLRADNGQHLLLGAYRNTLALLKRIGVEETEVLQREPMNLRMLRRDRGAVTLKAGPWPAPLHLFWALSKPNGLSAGERLAALRLCGSLWLHGFRTEPDMPVSDWLELNRQPNAVREALWEPLCTAALNTPVERASTAVFLRILQAVFAHNRHDSDLLVPRVDLSALLADPATAYIERSGGLVELGRRVSGLTTGEDRVTGVEMSGGPMDADAVVLAVSATACGSLLAPIPAMADISRCIRALTYQPITTVYLQYKTSVRLAFPMIGFCGKLTDWVFDRRVAGQPGLMAAVISAEGPHMRLDADALGRRVGDEVGASFPEWPAPTIIRVVREKRATFSCEPGTALLRPHPRTPVPGLWLAGDYTATPHPATLEGAVSSGLQCATDILGGET